MSLPARMIQVRVDLRLIGTESERIGLIPSITRINEQ
jgi:hypothetical protein